MCGGHDGAQCLSSVERFDPSGNRWERISPMKRCRYRLSGAAVQGKVYICGGHDGLERLGLAESFDPDQEEWISVQDMPEMRSGAAMAAVFFTAQESGHSAA